MKMSLIQKSQGPALGKPFPTLLSSPRFNVIGGDWRLTLCASKLSADGFSNPQDSRIERHAVRRSVVVGRTRSLPFLFLILCHADAPSQGSVGWKQRGAHSESQKFQSSTCGVELLASGGLPHLGDWQ